MDIEDKLKRYDELLQAAYVILKKKDLSWGEKLVVENEIKSFLKENGYVEE